MPDAGRRTGRSRTQGPPARAARLEQDTVAPHDASHLGPQRVAGAGFSWRQLLLVRARTEPEALLVALETDLQRFQRARESGRIVVEDRWPSGPRLRSVLLVPAAGSGTSSPVKPMLLSSFSVACIKLDRLARSTRHLVTLAADLEALGVDLVVLDQSIDTTTPSGRLLFHVLAAIAEFERDLIRDRVVAGLRRAKAQGRRLGRPRRHHIDVPEVRALQATGLSIRAIARRLHVHPMSIRRVLTSG